MYGAFMVAALTMTATWVDIFQLALVAIGLAAALPFVLHGAGGVQHAWAAHLAARPVGGCIVPPLAMP
jgi:hypothetical protein